MHSLGQRRRRTATRGLLRPVGDRQDDALGGPAAAASSATTSTAGATSGVFNFEGGCYAKTIRLSPMYEPDIFQTTRRFGTVLENVDLDPRDARARPRLGAVHREHPRRLPAPLHRQRRPDRDDGPADDRRLPDGRRVRRPAADLAADPRPGGVPLHQRLHGQAGRHRGRRQGAEGDVLGLLRGAVHAPPSGRVRARCWSSGSARAGRPGLAGEHRLDRRAVRDRRADEHRPHPRDGPGRARRRGSTTSRRGSTRSSASRCRSSCPDVPATFLDPRTTWADTDGLRPPGRGDWRRCSRRTSRPTPTASAPRSGRPARPSPRGTEPTLAGAGRGSRRVGQRASGPVEHGAAPTTSAPDQREPGERRGRPGARHDRREGRRARRSSPVPRSRALEHARRRRRRRPTTISSDAAGGEQRRASARSESRR